MTVPRSSSPTATASRTGSTCATACDSRSSRPTAGIGRCTVIGPPTDGRIREEFVLDSQAPSIPVKTYAYNEIRYKMLSYTKPEEASRLLKLAQEDIDGRWRVYKSLSERWPAAVTRGQSEPGSHVEGA